MRDQDRARLRLLWRTYAATQPTPRQAWGMAAALGRYFAAVEAREGGSSRSVDPIDRVGRV